MSAVKNWSYSAYALHAECPAKYKYAKIDKLPDPAGPAMERGRVIHKMAEDFLLRSAPMTPEIQNYEFLLRPLKEERALIVEQEWTWKKNWSQETHWRDWKEGWFRAKCDAGVIYEDNFVEIIDWKTGKKYETNADQVELFALSAMIRYPSATGVKTRLAYVDLPAKEEVTDEFSAKDRDSLKRKWVDKIVPMFTDETFAPRPSDRGCRFCNFSRSSGGPCRFG